MKRFICDGTAHGFFSAVFDAYNCKECVICSNKDVQLDLNTQIINVETDEQKARRVIKKLEEIAENNNRFLEDFSQQKKGFSELTETQKTKE